MHASPVGPEPNRLIRCTSPYLLQHAHDPVDWHPWGDEALAKARLEDKPIFLSIGYSACHWCHVMGRESFGDEAIAGMLNEHFVPIKVDREERPDLDELYMEAVQALVGRGGWPLNVWLAPDLKPFYGGTYIPPRSREGAPGLLELLERIAELWREHRGDLLGDADTLARHVERRLGVVAGGTLPGRDAVDRVLGELRRDFDSRWGGFGPAPKFPAPAVLEFLLRCGGAGDRAMALRTLDAMWEGGLWDHLGGGFARYSTDERWLVPHFEKMLCDNALLAHVCLEASLAAGRPRYAAVAREALEYLLRELRDGAGGFRASQDADSEGEEGRFYTWTPAEVASVLGAREGAAFCEAFGITEQGLLKGRSVLNRIGAGGEAGFGMDAARERLLAHREQRAHPRQDDKVLTAWNALAIRAFANGYAVLDDPRYLDVAHSCAEFVQRHLWREGNLLRAWCRGRAHVPGCLEDYAAMALALVELYETAFDVRWLRWAEEIALSMRDRFEDVDAGGFFSADASRGDLFLRAKTGCDGAGLSGNTLAVLALLRLAEHLDREDFRRSAERALACFASTMERFPRAHPGLAMALDRMLHGPTEVVISGASADGRTRELLDAARRCFLPRGLITLVCADPSLPLHAGRTSTDGIPAAYVCTKRACGAALVDAKALAMRLSEE